MALKYKINKEAYDALNDDMKSEYKKKGNEYYLDVEGEGLLTEDDVAELRRAKDREAQAAADARKDLREMRERLEALEGDDARKRGDIDALERSWKEKYETRENELNGIIDVKNQFIHRTLVKSTAENLATKISTAPKLMAKAIEERLTVEMNGNDTVLRVLDKDGKASALSVDDLERELLADKDYSAIIVASKASGGGAGTDAPRGTSGAAPQTVDVAKMTPEQHAAHIKQQREQRG